MKTQDYIDAETKLRATILDMKLAHNDLRRHHGIEPLKLSGVEIFTLALKDLHKYLESLRDKVYMTNYEDPMLTIHKFQSK